MIACEKTNNETLRKQEIVRNEDPLFVLIVCSTVMQMMLKLPIIKVVQKIGAMDVIILRSSRIMDNMMTRSTRDMTVETFWYGNCGFDIGRGVVSSPGSVNMWSFFICVTFHITGLMVGGASNKLTQPSGI